MTPDQQTLIQKAFEWKNKTPRRFLTITYKDTYGYYGYEEVFSIRCAMHNSKEEVEDFYVYNIDDLFRLTEGEE